MITCIILAAGTASRMGYCKQLLLWHKRPLVRIAAQAALDSPIDEVILVTGHKADEVSAAVNDLPIKVVFNPDFNTGQGSSLAAGIKAASEKAAAFTILLADQPLLGAPVISKLIDVYRLLLPLVLRPSYRGRPGHPVIISAKLRPELESLGGYKGARSLLAGLGDRVLDFEVDEPGVVFDIDTLDDWLKLDHHGPF